MPHRAPLLIAACLLSACVTPLEPGAEQVRMVNSGQKERQCNSLGTFTSVQRSGHDKPGETMIKARNEAYKRGGNAILIISSTTDSAEGAVFTTAEALKCQF
jgi:uncharacterized protein DUF4156